jgi:hypothetical protein
LLRMKAYGITLIIIIALLISGGWIRGEQRTPNPIWQYKVVEFDAAQSTAARDVEKMLDQQGSDGWELILTQESQTLPRLTQFYFKRAK